MRTGNCSSKVHTAKVEIFSNHPKKKKIVASSQHSGQGYCRPEPQGFTPKWRRRSERQQRSSRARVEETGCGSNIAALKATLTTDSLQGFV